MIYSLSIAVHALLMSLSVDETLLPRYVNVSKKREKSRRKLHKNATSSTEQILEASHHETTVVRPPTSYL